MNNHPLSTVQEPAPADHRITLVGLFLRVASFAIAWWAFTEGDWREWEVGAIVVATATAASLYILPLRSWRWSLRGLMAFTPYFLYQSVLGGFDVAWRALHVRMPLHPKCEQYETRLPAHLPRVFLVWTISLLPGTASIRLKDKQVTIHVLIDTEGFQDRMKDLEDRIGRIFGV